MRTHVACDGTSSLRTNIRYQPGGATYGPGGAVTVQLEPPHENAGNKTRAPIELPWVLASEPSSETLMFEAPEVTVNEYAAPFIQSLLSMVKAGRALP